MMNEKKGTRTRMGVFSSFPNPVRIPPSILRGYVTVVISEEDREALDHKVVICPALDRVCEVFYDYAWDTRCADCPLVQSSEGTVNG